MSDTINNYPVILAPYQFNNHPGWAGTGHCGVMSTEDGRYFMAHQGRLSPRNHLMVLHVREVFFNPDGWPVVSPQRYAGDVKRQVSEKEIVGDWELIRIKEPVLERQLEAGQILWGEGDLQKEEWNFSFTLNMNADKTTSNNGTWNFTEKEQLMSLTLGEETFNNLHVFTGHDWENQTSTILLTGLDDEGRTVWGKRIK